jgi:hypothetical protein
MSEGQENDFHFSFAIFHLPFTLGARDARPPQHLNGK